jgi:hypothetical protein
MSGILLRMGDSGIEGVARVIGLLGVQSSNATGDDTRQWSIIRESALIFGTESGAEIAGVTAV